MWNRLICLSCCLLALSIGRSADAQTFRLRNGNSRLSYSVPLSKPASRSERLQPGRESRAPSVLSSPVTLLEPELDSLDEGPIPFEEEESIGRTRVEDTPRERPAFPAKPSAPVNRPRPRIVYQEDEPDSSRVRTAYHEGKKHRTKRISYFDGDQDSSTDTPKQLPNVNKSPKMLTANEPSSELGLRSVTQIDVRAATQIPPVAAGSDAVRLPNDQAHAYLQQRTPVRYAVTPARDLRVSRNSFAFHHYPLYFEDPNLERCGNGCGIFSTPKSMLLFYGTIPILPYRLGAEPCRECTPALADCRYGECYGFGDYLPPLSVTGALYQAAATVGLIYLVP